MRDSRSQFLYGLRDGFATSALLGGIGAAVCAGVTALFGGPVVIVAAAAAGIFGLLGAAGSALGAATSGTGDYRASWTSGIPTTALMAAGILAFGGDRPTPETKPLPAPTTLTQTFKTASSAAEAGCVPAGSYPRTNIASTGPVAPR